MAKQTLVVRIESMKKEVACKDGETHKNVLFFPSTGKVTGNKLKLKKGGMTSVDDATFKVARVGMEVEWEK